MSLQRDGSNFSQPILEALAECANAKVPLKRMCVQVGDIHVGMILEEYLRSTRRQLLVATGQEVTVALRERLSYFVRLGQVDGDITVLVPVNPEKYDEGQRSQEREWPVDSED